MTQRTLLDPSRLEAEAADWFARVNDSAANAQVREQFTQWLLRSAQHLDAYLDTARVGGEVGLINNLPSADELVAAARADDESDNVVELRPSFKRPDRPSVTCKRRINRGRDRFRPALAAAVMFAATIAMGWIAYQLAPHPLHLQTQVGEQRSVVLEEGSTVFINTDSALSVALSKDQRAIELERGEARFTVAKDPNRPFIVITPQAIVRAVGTVFNVYISREGTSIAVIEGIVTVTKRDGSLDPNVRVTSSSAAPDVIALTAGQQAAVTTAGQIQSNPNERFARAAAWTQHQISFHDQTLADLVEEFNRYHKRPLRIADPELATYEISGTFDAFDYNSLLAYLERYQRVKVDRRDPDEIVLRRKR